MCVRSCGCCCFLEPTLWQLQQSQQAPHDLTFAFSAHQQTSSCPPTAGSKHRNCLTDAQMKMQAALAATDDEGSSKALTVELHAPRSEATAPAAAAAAAAAP
eukprot:CAMPEP_0177509096 /NCGR_PEP_ID=MMETSP0369-20130122/41387_1 /TAXON_ID=447022 ORGANISM="Scrippsiella hangoei-like, Strain SHHI-4" /NCGR_SAMPLE_ID=MMETSP0369 /ASSEMBLY_ACC=CAM_ASM_000364 /LENGTH=101 /DNA_ID=CAMNT_0018987269 /DNA_START=144 /DNA_END=446 /DNA_ORIENTATION=+